MNEDKQVFTPSEAIEYLAEKRGIHTTAHALRLRRLRGTVKAEHVTSRITLWTKEELDAIEPPRRGRKKKIQTEQEQAA
jgi:hypothetical protein